jgi:hypothetical protein
VQSGRPAAAGPADHWINLAVSHRCRADEISIAAPRLEAIHLYIPAKQFALLAEEYELPRTPSGSIRSAYGVQDEMIRQIGLSILSEMTCETAAGRMLVESPRCCSPHGLRIPMPTASPPNRGRPLGIDSTMSGCAVCWITWSSIWKRTSRLKTWPMWPASARVILHECSRRPSASLHIAMSASNGSRMRWGCWRAASFP